jgi:hypothetical protein
MTYDPALTAIAVATDDALTDHLWRHDIGDTDTTDPIAHIAAELHHRAAEFRATADMLTRLLTHVGDTYHQSALAVTDLADLEPKATETGQYRLHQQLGRFDAQRAGLLALYRIWRRHRPATPDPRVRHLWLVPHDPRWGMVTLHADHQGLAWSVTPDQTATEAFATPGPGVPVGDIWHGSAGWQTTAYRDPGHHSEPDRVFRLPPAAGEAAACRALLRWWALRDTEYGADLTPERLSADDRAELLR